MEVRFRLLDVFCDRPFAGNQLCVVPEPPADLDDAGMHTIAREIGFSETTFVTEAGGDRYSMRIFTPDQAALCPPDPLGLTPRERDILGLLALGATNAQIGSALGISPATVRKHLENAYGKLGVSTRTAAAARVIAEPHGLRG